MDIIKTLTEEFSLKPFQVENTVKLIDDRNTIPFIARYRKEAHGSLDDQTIRELSERLAYLRGRDPRREEVRGQEFELTTYIQTVISLLHIKILRSFFMPIFPPCRRIHNRVKHR